MGDVMHFSSVALFLYRQKRGWPVRQTRKSDKVAVKIATNFRDTALNGMPRMSPSVMRLLANLKGGELRGVRPAQYGFEDQPSGHAAGDVTAAKDLTGNDTDQSVLAQ